MKLLFLIALIPLAPFTAFANPYHAFDCSMVLQNSNPPMITELMVEPESLVMKFNTRAHVRGDQVFGFKSALVVGSGQLQQFTLAQSKSLAESQIKVAFSRKDEDGKPMYPGCYGVTISSEGTPARSWSLECGRDFALSTYVTLPKRKDLGEVVMTCLGR